MGLYSGENAETNEFEEMGSQLTERGDLEDLFYQFTYEVNNKLDELSERINRTEDVEAERDEEEAERMTGSVCAKQVCENNERLEEMEPRPPECENSNCAQKLYSTCLNQRWVNRVPGATAEDTCCQHVGTGRDPEAQDAAPGLAENPQWEAQCQPPHILFTNTTEDIINEVTSTW